jgi:hypothetical protein
MNADRFKYSNYSGDRSQNKKETRFDYGDTLSVLNLKKLVSCGRLHCFYSGFCLLNFDFLAVTRFVYDNKNNISDDQRKSVAK